MAEKTQNESALTSDSQSLEAWTTPAVRRMRAGDAEDGYDPIVPDAGITKS